MALFYNGWKIWRRRRKTTYRPAGFAAGKKKSSFRYRQDPFIGPVPLPPSSLCEIGLDANFLDRWLTLPHTSCHHLWANLMWGCTWGLKCCREFLSSMAIISPNMLMCLYARFVLRLRYNGHLKTGDMCFTSRLNANSFDKHQHCVQTSKAQSNRRKNQSTFDC